MVGDVANGRRTARAPMPVGPASESVMGEEFGGPPGDLEQLLELSRRRRRDAETAAEAAESAAADAASRAAAAIAAAARAAEEAEDAADAAAAAAEEAAAAAAAENDAVAQAEAARRVRMSTRNAVPHGGFPGGPRGGPQGVPQGVPQPRASFTPPHGQHSGAFPLPAPEAEVPWPPPHLQNGHPQPGQRPVDGAPSEATAVIPVITPDTTAVIAAIPADAAPPTAEIGPLTVPGPVAGGRAARRRAQEAAAAVAREATRDPETVAFAVDDKVVEPGAPHSEPQEQEESLASTVRGRGFRLRDIPPVWLVGAGVDLLIAIAAFLATAVASNGAPASAALNPPTTTTTSAAAAPAGNQEAAAPRQSETDPTSPKAVAYLTALRNADITTSKTGQPETEAAAVLCEQIGQGVDENELVKALPAVLPTVTKKQAPDVVRLAKKHYC